jgi:hypothetical protein
MRLHALAVVLVGGCAVAGCSGTAGGGGDDGGAPDLAGADLGPRSTAGIACGASACYVDAQLCCTGDSGKSGTCDPVQAGTCGHAEFFCDGPEDCPPAEPICCVRNGIARCQSAGACAAPDAVMCHVVGDCATGQACCGAPGGSPYALCLSSACP